MFFWFWCSGACYLWYLVVCGASSWWLVWVAVTRPFGFEFIALVVLGLFRFALVYCWVLGLLVVLFGGATVMLVGFYSWVACVVTRGISRFGVLSGFGFWWWFGVLFCLCGLFGLVAGGFV